MSFIVIFFSSKIHNNSVKQHILYNVFIINTYLKIKKDLTICNVKKTTNYREIYANLHTFA